jgi:hypothetical protein
MPKIMLVLGILTCLVFLSIAPLDVQYNNTDNDSFLFLQIFH